MATAIARLEDSKSKEGIWVWLDHLDKVLDDLLPILDPEWAVTEYIENRWSPAGVAYSPAEWTDPKSPSPDEDDPPRNTSRDW